MAPLGCECVHDEPVRAGVTPRLPWRECQEGSTDIGLVPKSRSTSCRGHGSYVGRRDLTNHLDHKPDQTV